MSEEAIKKSLISLLKQREHGLFFNADSEQFEFCKARKRQLSYLIHNLKIKPDLPLKIQTRIHPLTSSYKQPPMDFHTHLTHTLEKSRRQWLLSL